MRKFTFRLQRALRFALLRENQKKTQIASCLQRIRFLQKYIERLAGELRLALEESHRDVGSLTAEANRLSIVPKIDEQKRLEKLLQDESSALNGYQQDLIRLSQRRRSLESLKEKKRAEFKQEVSRLEQKTVDEMSGLSRARSLSRFEEIDGE